MKNDFDFIKEKFESSGVKAPDSLDKDAVLAMLEDKQPAPIPLRPKRRWPAVVAVAASLVIVASLGIVLGSRFIGNKPQTAPPTTVIADIKSLQTFDSYNDVKDAVGSIRKLNQKKDSRMFEAINSDMAADGYSEAGNSASAESGNSSSSSHSETYKQVEGVDEADIIKTDGRYIYCVENRYNAALIKIFSADGDSSRLITTLDASKQSSSTADEAALSYSDAYYYDYRFTISDMYLRDHTLVLLCMDHRDAGETVTEAAVRETCEELGLRPEDIEILSERVSLIMGDGREIHPVEARLYIDGTNQLRLSEDEVAEVFLLPIEWLKENPPVHYDLSAMADDELPGRLLGYLSHYGSYRENGETDWLEYEGHGIWGLTARILMNYATRKYD